MAACLRRPTRPLPVMAAAQFPRASGLCRAASAYPLFNFLRGRLARGCCVAITVGYRNDGRRRVRRSQYLRQADRVSQRVDPVNARCARACAARKHHAGVVGGGKAHDTLS